MHVQLCPLLVYVANKAAGCFAFGVSINVQLWVSHYRNEKMEREEKQRGREGECEKCSLQYLRTTGH